MEVLRLIELKNLYQLLFGTNRRLSSHQTPGTKQMLLKTSPKGRYRDTQKNVLKTTCRQSPDSFNKFAF
jgi:hypothetical protein